MAYEFDHKHYVPILKAKLGEYRALETLTASRKSGLTPLLELPPIDWDFENECPKCTIDEQIEKEAATILKCWGSDSRFFIDGFQLEDEGQTAANVHPLVHIANDAGAKNLRLVPVTGLTRNPAYQAAVNAIQTADHRGICLRVTIQEASGGAHFAANLAGLLETFGLHPSSVDMIIDAGPLLPGYEGTYLLAARTAVANFPQANDWRSLTFASSAYPADSSNMPRNAVTLMPRVEWWVWTQLAAIRAELPRMPAFGDYAINSPGHDQLDFRVIKMTANVRYTHTTHFVIVRGQLIRKGEASQYPGLATILRARPEYVGPAFSWGDQYIENVVVGSAGPGSATTWRQVGVSHHASFVVDQIASFPGL